jgi:CHAT domain-containing protein/tetratricopeptide (TPR) repeat protein
MFGLAHRSLSRRLAPLRLGIAVVIASASICAADEALLRQQQAIKRIDGYLEHYRRTHDRVSLLPDLERADTELAASSDEFISRGHLEAAALSLIKRGDISRYRGLSDWQQAIDFYQQAYDLAQQASHLPHQAEALIRLAQAEAGRRDYGAAAAYIEKALGVSTGIDDKRYLSNSLDQLAFIQSHRGDLVAAAETRTRALAMAEAMHDDLRLFYGHDGRAGVYEDLGAQWCDYRGALELCDEALKLARADYERALELARKLGYRGLAQMTEESLQRVKQRRDLAEQRRDLEDSLRRVERELMERRESADKDRQVPAVAEVMHDNLRLFYGPDGRVLVHERFTLGRLDLPAEVVKQTQEVVEFAPGEAYAWRFHLEASLLEAQGDNDAALAAYLKAIELLEADRSTLREDQNRGTFLKDKISLYYRPILHLLERRRLGEAFNLLERSRSRALADLLASKPLTLERSKDRELYAELRQIEVTVTLRQRELFGERGKVGRKRSTERMAEIEQAIQDLQQEHQRLLGRIAAEAPKLRQLPVATPAPLASLQQLQHSIRQEGYEILQYLVLESNLIVWHISGDAVQVKSVFLPRSQLIKKVEHLRKSLSNRDEQFAERTARELFLFLIQPVLSRIGSEHLVIIPHEDLYYIPFQVLQDPSTHTYLGERYRISYAPSATILMGLSQAGNLAAGKLLAVADPTIASARQEVTAIARWYPDRHKAVNDVLVNKTTLKAWVADYDLLHLSVHGEFTPQEPLLSHLQLAKDGQDDGKLTAAEMFGLPLEGSRLVVLSACETGQAEVTHANEVLGMVRALLYAGANTLMLSSWKVDAASTARWMEVFYHEAQTQSVSEAARLALRAVKNDPQYGHPYYWGPFVMIGK